MPCPDTVNLANGLALPFLIGMILQWLCLPFILRNAVYVQFQERYGIAFQKMLVGRRYWKIVDDIILAGTVLLSTVLRKEGLLYLLLCLESTYAILLENLQPYSFLGGNCLANLNRSFASSLACSCACIVFSGFVLAYIQIVFQVRIRNASLDLRGRNMVQHFSVFSGI